MAYQIQARARPGWIAGVLISLGIFLVALLPRAVGLGAFATADEAKWVYRSAQFLFWGHIRGGGAWSGVFLLRFSFLVIGIGAALYFGAHPVGLLIGLSLIMPAAIFEAWRARPAVDPEAPELAPDDPAWERWNPWLARERVESDEVDE